jgi:penicillin G amidase
MTITDVASWMKEHPGREPLWNDVKSNRASHLLRIGPLGEPIMGGGSADAINALKRDHGPSWRMVVSLEPKGVRIWATYPGGQSGNAGSQFYNNLMHSWEQGQHYELSMFKNREDRHANERYTLLISKP